MAALDNVHQEVSEAKSEAEGDEEAVQLGPGLDENLTEESVAQSDDSKNDTT